MTKFPSIYNIKMTNPKEDNKEGNKEHRVKLKIPFLESVSFQNSTWEQKTTFG